MVKHLPSFDLKTLSIPLLEDLDTKNVSKILAAITVQSVPKGEIVFNAEDNSSHLFFIVSGWVKLYRLTRSGEENIIALYTKGDLFGETSFFDEKKYSLYAKATEPAVIAKIPAIILKSIAKEDPRIIHRIMMLFSQRMLKLQIKNEHLCIMSAAQRIGCLLLNLATSVDGKGGTFKLPYDKCVSASKLGMKAETFSRGIAQLKEYGVTVSGMDVHIDSYEKLAEYVCNHCSLTHEECAASHIGGEET